MEKMINKALAYLEEPKTATQMCRKFKTWESDGIRQAMVERSLINRRINPGVTRPIMVYFIITNTNTNTETTIGQE